MYLNKMANKQEFSKYERARIIGARGLQISMDAPILINIDEKKLDAINYDPLKIAESELDSGILPISVNRPMPEKKEEDIENIKIEEKTISDAQKEMMEKQEVEDIAKTGEMMKLTNTGENMEADNTDHHDHQEESE